MSFIKKIWLILISLTAIVMIIVIYQQHQLIRDYRGLLYSEMEILNIPVERILEFHQEAASYDEKERNEKLEQLEESFADFFNFTGASLQLEPEIRAKYYVTYNDSKLAFARIIERYIDATTAEEREQAYQDLKEQYGQYQSFLKVSEEELVEPI